VTDIAIRLTDLARTGQAPAEDMAKAIAAIDEARARSVSAARRKARELEKEIALALVRFHNDTGVTVHGLHLRVDRASGPDGVEVDVRYSVNVEAVL
jgi:hypothetical protein